MEFKTAAAKNIYERKMRRTSSSSTEDEEVIAVPLSVQNKRSGMMKFGKIPGMKKDYTQGPFQIKLKLSKSEEEGKVQPERKSLLLTPKRKTSPVRSQRSATPKRSKKAKEPEAGSNAAVVAPTSDEGGGAAVRRSGRNRQSVD